MKTLLLQGRPFHYPEPLDACVRKVLEEHEYGHPDVPLMRPVKRVLDIGANVGAFAVWANMRWPGCWIDCYEPHPQAAELCRRNVPQGTQVHEVAVTVDRRERVPLHVGDGGDWGYNTLLVATGNPVERIGAVMVQTLDPRKLPKCDALKLDCEGCELEILANYPHLEDVQVVLFEWHFEDALLHMQSICKDAGLRLFAARHDRVNLGQQVWMRSSAQYDIPSGKYVEAGSL